MSLDAIPGSSHPLVRQAMARIARLQRLALELERDGFDATICRRVIATSWEAVLIFSESVCLIDETLERVRQLDGLPESLKQRR